MAISFSGCGAKADLESSIQMESAQTDASEQDSTSEQDSALDSAPILTGVTVNITVRDIGQYPENFVLTFDKDIPRADISASYFSMTGTAGMWGSEDKRDFTCSFKDVTIQGNTLTLVPDSFPEKYFYVEEFEVTCEKEPSFCFTDKDVTSVITAVADEFETLTWDGDVSFDYRLFTPADPEKKPLVIVFHGYGDTNNLLTYKTAVAWAEPENQAKRPCYVLAPVIEDKPYFQAASRDRIYDAVEDIVDSLVAEGKVDKNRVYVMGNSFGGLATIEFCEKYPGIVAGALALCPATTYAQNANLNLEKMKDVPVWFAHAEHDNTIPVSATKIASQALETLGAREVRTTIYSDDNMNAVGADPSPDATYSYHHVELAVMQDETYMEWLFEQVKN